MLKRFIYFWTQMTVKEHETTRQDEEVTQVAVTEEETVTATTISKGGGTNGKNV